MFCHTARSWTLICRSYTLTTKHRSERLETAPAIGWLDCRDSISLPQVDEQTLLRCEMQEKLDAMAAIADASALAELDPPLDRSTAWRSLLQHNLVSVSRVLWRSLRLRRGAHFRISGLPLGDRAGGKD